MRVAREAAALAAISLRLSDGSNGQVLSDSGCMRADRIAGALATRVMLMTGRASNVQYDGQAKQSTAQKSESHDNRPCLQERVTALNSSQAGYFGMALRTTGILRGKGSYLPLYVAIG